MPRNLDLTALRSFVAVADLGGVTRASTALHLTQSAVSMQLKRLEESTGLNLLDRSARKIRLTAEGELLASYARKMLAVNDEAWERLTTDHYEGEIVFGVPHDIVYPHVPEILKQFSAEYPKVKVRLVSSYTVSLKEELRNGTLDLTLTTEPTPGPVGACLHSQNMVWVGAVNGRAWRQRPLRLASQQRCAFRPMCQKALDGASIPWEMATDTDSSMTVSAVLSADLGIEGRVASAVPNDLEVIDHGGDLPELPLIHTNLYVSDEPGNHLVAELAETVRKTYLNHAGRGDGHLQAVG